jgi:hypothetical protein
VSGLLGLLLLIGGVAWLVYDHQQVAEARDWPSVQGRIDYSQVESRREYSRRRYRTQYTPIVRYSYAVGGTTYSNDDIWVTGSHSYSSQDNAAEVLQPYPVGAPVQVHYAAADPRRSALRIEGNTALGIFLTLMGVALIGVAWWMRRRMA